MRPLVSSDAALEADRLAREVWGYPDDRLMEEAGLRLAQRLESVAPEGPVVVLTGPGNNGGDGWVLARHAFLQGRRRLTVVAVEEPRSPLCRSQADLAKRLGIPALAWTDLDVTPVLESAPVWIDAIWGTGLQRPLEGAAFDRLADLERRREQRRPRVFAVDVPSGVRPVGRPTDPVLRADETWSIAWVKRDCLEPRWRPAAGRLHVVPVAFPQAAKPSADLMEASDEVKLVPTLASESHKGQRGHVLVVGGAPGMAGAARLAAGASAAAGAGLVSLAVDSSLQPFLASDEPSFQVRIESDAWDRRSHYDAVVLGPGWGTEGRTSILERWWSVECPLVVDADGLRAWDLAGQRPRQSPTVVTPHPGEFRALLKTESWTLSDAQAWADQKNVVLVLKGAVTWIFAREKRPRVWDGNNPALATGGSGDSLAGIIGAFLASGQSAFEAASAGVVLHGQTGAQAAEELGWFTASQMLPILARRSATCRIARQGL